MSSCACYAERMIYQVTGKGVDITDEMRGYAERRLEHIERVVGEQKTEPLLQSELEFHTGEAAAPYTVRCVLDVAHEPSIHAEAHGTTMHEAIDAAAKVLAHEVEKIKGKRHEIRRDAAAAKDILREVDE